MNLASRHCKNVGCRENQNQQNGVPKSRHSNKELFLVMDRVYWHLLTKTWDELCSGNGNSHPAMQRTQPLPVLVPSQALSARLAVAVTRHSQGGEVQVVMEMFFRGISPLLMMSLPEGLCCELWDPCNSFWEHREQKGALLSLIALCMGLHSYLFSSLSIEDKNLNYSEAPFYIVSFAFDCLFFYCYKQHKTERLVLGIRMNAVERWQNYSRFVHIWFYIE